MISFKNKVFLLTILFAVMFICILHMDCAQAASKPSKKTEVKTRIINKSIKTTDTKRIKIASRGSQNTINPAASDMDGNSIVPLAITYLGAKYQYGGSGPNAFDCSGFTRHIMKELGINLPRTSREQANIGTKISKENLKPGDLVFFATSEGRRISHVGLYIGNGKFVHASLSKGRIVVSSLGEKYFTTRFVMASRVIG